MHSWFFSSHGNTSQFFFFFNSVFSKKLRSLQTYRNSTSTFNCLLAPAMARGGESALALAFLEAQHPGPLPSKAWVGAELDLAGCWRHPVPLCLEQKFCTSG